MMSASRMQVRVLVVDDDPMVGRSLGRTLTSLGCKFEVHRDAASALSRLAAARFDVVLCDLMMPGLDGLQFIQHARGANIQVPIIIISGRARPRDVVSAHRLGAADCLLKPFDEDELEAAIGRALFQGLRTQDTHTEDASDAAATERATPAVIGSKDEAALLQAKLEQCIETETLELPIPPALLCRMIELNAADVVDEEEVIEVIDSSATLAASVMQAARRMDVSRASTPARTLNEALIRLGTARALRHALTVASRATSHTMLRSHPDIVNSLWVHHLISARAAEHLARELVPTVAPGIHGLALFMEMGEVLVLRALSKVVPELLLPGIDPAAAVAWVTQLHGPAGRKTLRRWGLPEVYGEVALLHTQETALGFPITPANQTMLIVRAARQLATHVSPGSKHSARHKLTAAELKGLPGLDPPLLQRTAQIALEDVKSILGLESNATGG